MAFGTFRRKSSKFQVLISWNWKCKISEIEQKKRHDLHIQLYHFCKMHIITKFYEHHKYGERWREKDASFIVVVQWRKTRASNVPSERHFCFFTLFVIRYDYDLITISRLYLRTSTIEYICIYIYSLFLSFSLYYFLSHFLILFFPFLSTRY